MTDSEYKAAAEAILFTMGTAVPLHTLAQALEISDERMEELLRDMETAYQAPERGIQLRRLDDSYQLSTKPQFFRQLVAVASQPKRYTLSQALLETLAIVAYKQPVTRLEIEKIRGVSSGHALNRLVEYGLIEEAGRLNAPGRPLLFGTTEEFLRAFGLSQTGDLPQVSAEEFEKMKQMAEAEADRQEVPAENNSEKTESPIDVEI
ncbi:MAG: SMC-Scp complex subunit ScpB [Lachnospira sp.]|nr:SMC-Scp complex subunit ScpB [Lachnospira sp.]